MNMTERFTDYRAQGGVCTFTEYCDYTGQIELLEQRLTFHRNWRNKWFDLFNMLPAGITIVANSVDFKRVYLLDMLAGNSSDQQAFKEFCQRQCEYHASVCIVIDQELEEKRAALNGSIYPVASQSRS